MGSACGGPTEGGAPVTMQTEVKLWGDYLSQSTRALIILMKHSGVEFTFKEINTLKFEHESEDYEKVNPCKTIPTITKETISAKGIQGNTERVLSDEKQLYMYVIRTNPKV